MKRYIKLLLLLGFFVFPALAEDFHGGITSEQETESASELFGENDETPQRLTGDLTQRQRLEFYLKRQVQVSLAIKTYLKKLSNDYVNLDNHEFHYIPKALNKYGLEIEDRISKLRADLKNEAAEIDEAFHQRELVKTDIANNVLEIANHLEFLRMNPFTFNHKQTRRDKLEWVVKRLGKRKVQKDWYIVEYSQDDELLNGLIDTRNAMLGINLRDPENKGPSVEERVQSFLRMATAARYENPPLETPPEEASK